MTLNNISIIILGLFLIFQISCSGGEMSKETIKFPSIKDVSVSKWEKLAQKKIYFGHQSVGHNIIEGIRDLIKEYSDISLNIVETSNQANFELGIFAHSKVGKNMDPISKIYEFKTFMNNGLGGKADKAFFKFCYIDINPKTHVEHLFAEYKNTMLQLKLNYPKTKFIHVTIPLKIVQTGPRAWIKKLMGRPIGGYKDNIKRNQFNDLLRTAYREKEPIFDLALVESTYSDGSRQKFQFKGNSYHALIPEYSYDGRHLNQKGRKIVAEQLLIYMANL
jgi:hypothetical protein